MTCDHLLNAGSVRQSQTGEGSKPAQGHLMEWPVSTGASRALPSALTQLPGLLAAIDRVTACAGQAAHMRQLLSCQDVCTVSDAACMRKPACM